MRTVAMNIHGYSMQKVNKKAGKYFQKKRKYFSQSNSIFPKKRPWEKDCSMPDVLLYILFLRHKRKVHYHNS